MSGLEAALVALGAAIGAPLRFVAGHAWDRRVPWGTFSVNVAGSVLLGAFAGLALAGPAWAFFGTGFCGGLTTYSAFAVRTHDLGPRVGTAYAVGSVVVAVAGCWLGFVLAAGASGGPQP